MESSEVNGDSSAWYADLGPTLSQGDVVDLTPYGLIDDPLTLCQPLNADPKGKSNYAPLAAISKRRRVEFIHARGDVGLGLVVWPDCQIDKLKNQNRPESDWFVGVAPVHALSRILVDDVRKNVLALNRAQFFPLPQHSPIIAEASYVDFRYVWPVRYSLLKDRKIALSESARQALAVQLFWFLTEIRMVAGVPCPSCGGNVNSAEFFKFKDEGEVDELDDPKAPE